MRRKLLRRRNCCATLRETLKRAGRIGRDHKAKERNIMKPTHGTIEFFRFLPVLVVAALLMAGCSDPAEGDRDPVALGSDLNFAGLKLRSVLLVTSGQDEPARVLGTIINTTATDIELVLADSDEQVPVKIPANGNREFDQTPVILNSAPEAPGARADLTVSVKGQETIINVPIQNGTFDQYQPYIPSASP